MLGGNLRSQKFQVSQTRQLTKMKCKQENLKEHSKKSGVGYTSGIASRQKGRKSLDSGVILF